MLRPEKAAIRAGQASCQLTGNSGTAAATRSAGSQSGWLLWLAGGWDPVRPLPVGRNAGTRRHGRGVEGVRHRERRRRAPQPLQPTSTQSTVAGPSQLQNADGLKGLLDTLRSHFGDTMGFQLTVYHDYAVLEQVSPSNS